MSGLESAIVGAMVDLDRDLLNKLLIKICFLLYGVEYIVAPKSHITVK